MASHGHNGPAKQSSTRQDRNAPRRSSRAANVSSQPSREGRAQKAAQDVAGLKDYQLGDCLGKGAFGSVYRALNWGTGETVAVKQVTLANVPRNELKVIMSEIDLLKNLNHPNIVKYHGSVESTDSLYIILEYCENGSLHSICKNFGKFPENLVALYMSQVLHGLLYLHEQGVIHRDIKGANILTTKEGLVKLADFGVATKATGLDESSVVGTPYWMAPEVIELSGATTASDIWSLGCTVIELMEGKPPYHKLQPMQALFRIVNDEHPPLPGSASPAARDFLTQCFQKNPNLRISARRLLKHAWIMSAKRADSVVPIKPTKYDEAVKSVQEWNEALKQPGNNSLLSTSRHVLSIAGSKKKDNAMKPKSSASGKRIPSGANGSPSTDIFRSSEAESGDVWDDDFITSIGPTSLKLRQFKPHDNFAGLLSSEKLKAYATFDTVTEESFAEDFGSEDLTLKSPVYSNKTPSNRSKLANNQIGGYQHKPKSSKSNISGSYHDSQNTSVFRGIPVSKRRFSSGRNRPSNVYRENSVEDYSDLIAADDAAFQRKLQAMQAKAEDSSSPRLFQISDLKAAPPSTRKAEQINSARARVHSGDDKTLPNMCRTQSDLEIQKYAEDANDADFSDIFGKEAVKSPRQDSESGSEHSTLAIPTKMSTSWLATEEEEVDPFAHLEESLDEIDLAHNAARDRDVRLHKHAEDLVGRLKVSQPDYVLLEIAESLLDVLLESPEKKSVIVKSHGMLPILEVLGNGPPKDIVIRLLKIVNIVVAEDADAQESLCYIGGIPIITSYAHRKFPSEIRKEAAAFVRQMCQTSTTTLQFFIATGGLNVLVEFLEEDLDTERDLVLIGVNGVWSVFELQGSVPKNDFCRIFSRSSVLYPLSLILNRVLDEDGEVASLIQERIVNIFLIFSQAENHVKEVVADRMVMKRVLKDLNRMQQEHQITMLKFIKNLSMLATTHDSLESSNAIEVLTDLLKSSKSKPQFREVSNQLLNTMYNLCRHNKSRQQEAALNDIIPLLKSMVQTDWPLKEFALPILCDMAHSGKVCRKKLWEQKGIQFYISLLADRYWQVTALDAIFIWLQEETARVEQHLLSSDFSGAVIQCFTNPDTSPDAFENLLEPLQKLLRLSPPVASALASPAFFARITAKLFTKKPVVRLNLLRIIRSICDASDEQGSLLRVHDLYDNVARLAETDPAILVREMAEQLVNNADTITSPLYRSSSNLKSPSTPLGSPPLLRSQSAATAMSPIMKSRHPIIAVGSVFDPPKTLTQIENKSGVGVPVNRPAGTSAIISRPQPFRPNSRDGNSGSSTASNWSSSGGSVSSKSRLPRTKFSRLSLNTKSSTERDENATPTSTPLTFANGKFMVKRRRQPSTANETKDQ